MLDYSLDTISQLTIYDIVAHSKDLIDSNIDFLLGDKQLRIGEVLYRRRDGSCVDVEVNASVISYGGREIICTVIRDITERKQAEAILSESKERFAKAFNASPLILTISSLKDGRIKALRPAFASLQLSN